MEKQIEFSPEHIILDNGMTLLYSRNDRLPIVSLSAFVLAGSDRNPPDRPGLASLTSRLIDEGSENYSALQLAGMIESVGGSFSTFSQRELSGISLQLQSPYLEMGLELLAEMLCRPAFPQDRVELEKRKVLSHLRAMEDDPHTVGSRLLNQVIFSGTPFEHPVLGTRESIRALNRSAIQEFHSTAYAPENSILAVVGNFKTETLIGAMNNSFSKWTNQRFSQFTLPPLQRQAEPVHTEYQMRKKQLNILIGHLGITRTHPDFHALQALDVILGGGPGFTSRIPRRLRDEQGLAYSTYSDISGSSGLYPGRFVAYISTSPRNRNKALEGLLSEIETICKQGISEEELQTAQDFLTGNFVFEFQSNSNVARFLLGTHVYGLGFDYPNRYRRIISSLTAEEIARVARLHLDTVNYTTVIVGPAARGGRRVPIKTERRQV
jgi:zinc protease